MAHKDDELKGVNREEITEAARDPDQAKKDGAKLFGAGMTTPDSTEIPWTPEGEPDERSRRKPDPSDRDDDLGREKSER